MKKLLYPIAFALTAFLFIYSCSAEEDTTPPPSVVTTPEPEPPASSKYTLTVTAGEGGTVSNQGGTYDDYNAYLEWRTNEFTDLGEALVPLLKGGLNDFRPIFPNSGYKVY